MRVLCSCNPLAGHLYPMLPLAGALRDAGHDVAFVTGAEVGAELHAAGHDLLEAGPAFGDLVGAALGRYPDTPLATPEDQQRFGFQRLFSEIRVEATLPDVTARTAEFRPDLVLNEPAEFVGPLVAAQRGIPNATLGIGLVMRDEWLQLAAAAVAPAWTAAGLEPTADAGLYRYLYLNGLPRSLQRPAVERLPSVHDLRPIAFGAGTPLPADLEHLGRGRPLVYVTFGTMFGDVAMVNRVLADLAALDVDVLVTIGKDADPDAIDADSGRVVVRRFVPQGAVLDRCALCVTHGGVGSLVGPLTFGVPLVVVPLGADQAENAEQVARVGVGSVVPPHEVGSARLADAVDAGLHDAEVRRVARALQDEIAAMPAPEAVVGPLAALVP